MPINKLCAALVACCGVAAIYPSGIKPVPPKQAFVIAPTIAKDIACARDYAKAISAGGVEGRRLLSDLFSLACIESFESIYLISGPKLVSVRLGSKTVSFTEGLFMCHVPLNQMAFGKVKDIDADRSCFSEGLVLTRDVHRISSEAMARTICETNKRDPDECAAEEKDFEDKTEKKAGVTR